MEWEDGGSECEGALPSPRSSLWSLPTVTGKRGSRRLRRTGLGASRGGGVGQGAGAAAAAGANRGDRDAGGTGTGTPLFKSLFPLRDPALAFARSPGWGRAWGLEAGGAPGPGECSRQGCYPGGCGPGEWAGRGCPGRRVGSEWIDHRVRRVRAGSGACTLHHPPFGKYQN